MDNSQAKLDKFTGHTVDGALRFRNDLSVGMPVPDFALKHWATHSSPCGIQVEVPCRFDFRQLGVRLRCDPATKRKAVTRLLVSPVQA
jgi:hypothetical protein